MRRRKDYSDLLDVAIFIAQQQQTAGKLHGYRWMHLKCLQNNLRVPRDSVYEIMKLLDPGGMAARRRQRLKRRQYVSKGPDFVWHIDSYDKLKPYGIAINGCIDGFSRNIMWLEASTTNSDPKVIAYYFIQAVRRKKGVPKRIRTDMGTENTHVEQMQVFLRRNHQDELSGQKSFLYGKSTHYQRIEWFWGCLRKKVGQFWMDLFQNLSSDNESTSFCGTFLDKSLIQFCFIKLIQKDLDELAAMWNTHTISSSVNRLREGNRPLMMYTLPELFGCENQLCPVNTHEVNLCEEETTPKPEHPCDDTVKELCFDIMEETGDVMPDNAFSAKELYLSLRDAILEQL
uniref:Integrase core domain-containing protein n=1 Tax=Magallana gigas TaxID=29159 RepID=A0A8W8K035_MAGGI